MKEHLGFLIILLLILFFTNKVFSSADNSTDAIKRTVAVLPFYNLKKDKNGFYSNLIRDAVKARLMEKQKYILIEFGDINKNIEKFNYNIEDLNLDEQKAGNFAKSLNADIVIYGSFAVQNEQINISVSAYDIIFKKSIAAVSENGDTGLEIFNLINEKIGRTLADKLSMRVTKIDRKILDELDERNRYKIEENSQEIIQELLKEKEKYYRIEVDIQGKEFPLAIPRGYNTVIFIKDEPGAFEIKYNDQIYKSNSFGLKIMVFENEIGAQRIFSLIKDETESMTYRYMQKKDSEIAIKRIKFKKDKIKFTMLRNEQNYLISSSVFTGISGLTLLSGIFTAGFMAYYIDLYNKTPIEEPLKLIEYRENAYSLFAASIVLFSIGGAFLIPAVIFWYFYGYCRHLKKSIPMNNFSFEIFTSGMCTGFAFKIKFL